MFLHSVSLSLFLSICISHTFLSVSPCISHTFLSVSPCISHTFLSVSPCISHISLCLTLYLSHISLCLILYLSHISLCLTLYLSHISLCLTLYPSHISLSPRSKRLREYTTQGACVHEIKLDLSLTDPQHALKLSPGLYILSHSGSTQNRVCLVDASGQVLRSYGGLRGSAPGQLNGPSCLAVDKLGCVFVADYLNNRIQILSPDADSSR